MPALADAVALPVLLPKLGCGMPSFSSMVRCRLASGVFSGSTRFYQVKENPVLLPKQSTSVCAIIEALSTPAGSVITTLALEVQLFASVMVTIQVPAVRPFAFCVFCTGTVFH